MKIKKRIALVTGANKGLGFEICKQLLEKNLYVILTSRDFIKGEKAYKKLSTYHDSLEFQELDVTNDKQISTLFNYIKTTHGHCDVLINNAGIFPDQKSNDYDTKSSIQDAIIDDIKAGMQTNAYAALKLCQAVVPLMKSNNYGRIVNMSSGMGQLSFMSGGYPGYKISKTALNAITRIFADELMSMNILVNSLCPGWVKTDMGGSEATRELPEGADTAIWLATLPDNGPTGGFFRDRHEIPW